MADVFEVIPAIDLMNGACVRLSQGDFDRKTVYDGSPLETALSYERAGFKRLHMVDLDGARFGRVRNLEVLEEVAKATSLAIDFSGGIKSDEDLGEVFAAGAAFAGIGSVAVKQPEVFSRWLHSVGPERILLGADVREGRVAVDGWQTETSIDVVEFLIRQVAQGVTQAYVTDISKDGLLEGPAIALYSRLIREVPALRLIASGGVTSIEDIRALKDIGCAGVIVGKAIYEGHIDLEELGRFC